MREGVRAPIGRSRDAEADCGSARPWSPRGRLTSCRPDSQEGNYASRAQEVTYSLDRVFGEGRRLRSALREGGEGEGRVGQGVKCWAGEGRRAGAGAGGGGKIRLEFRNARHVSTATRRGSGTGMTTRVPRCYLLPAPHIHSRRCPAQAEPSLSPVFLSASLPPFTCFGHDCVVTPQVRGSPFCRLSHFAITAIACCRCFLAVAFLE